jgi:hypothetical protein
VEQETRRILLEMSELLSAFHERVVKLETRNRALQIVLAKATGVGLQFAEDHLEKIEADLRPSDEKALQVSTIIELLRKGKDLNKSDA